MEFINNGDMKGALFMKCALSSPKDVYAYNESKKIREISMLLKDHLKTIVAIQKKLKI